MKFTDALRGYRPLSDEDARNVWDTCVFCLDTNVLLNVYRYSEESRNEFLGVVAAIKGRLFVPGTVAHEFARNRAKVIRQQFDPHGFTRKKLQEIADQLAKDHKRHPHCGELLRLVQQTQSEEVKAFDERVKQQEALLANDHVLDKLLDIIGDDVGDPLPDAEVMDEYERRHV
jgi:hypothetical protein